MMYDEDTESFQLLEVQLVENDDTNLTKRVKIHNAILKRLASLRRASSVESFHVDTKQSPQVTVPSVVI